MKPILSRIGFLILKGKMFKKISILLYLLIFLMPLNTKLEAEEGTVSPMLTLPAPPPMQEEAQNIVSGIEQKPIAKPNLSNQESNPGLPKEKARSPFLDFINTKAYAAKIDEEEEKKILREKWKELLGIDIFYPYFKAKEVEHWIRNKASIKIFGMKGRPKFDRNQIIYTFKVTF